MLIIVEGPDGAGKSTLIRRLKELSEKPLISISRGKRFKSYEEMRQFDYWLATAAARTQLNVVIDRHPKISEWIYSEALKRPTLLEHVTPKELIRSLIHLLERPRVIFLLPPFEILHMRAHRLPQMDGILENLNELYQAYWNFALTWRDISFDSLRVVEPFPPDSLLKEILYENTNDRGSIYASTRDDGEI